MTQEREKKVTRKLSEEGGATFSATLTQRKQDELSIQRLTSDWPVVDLDKPEKIATWAKKDD
ncbi:MAG: hypothetical protein ACLUCR_05615 [Limosilactobacillus fermentum]|uniref:hypothetical protein n=1 Tax=Limosilactobacillus fermentum TaxID=1613 RepID=UPI0009757A5A|nr:hypothetical protein [Limosilactobacillus fermentum]MCJ2388536.1 hypothetical protein [Limosilactobacillus fermentum]MDU4240291.1 hypothetical protein [Limosilactobacillus fermentum]